MAVTYLETIDKERWTRLHFPHPRLAHDTSNHGKALNAVFIEFRKLPLFQLIEELWTYIMQKRHEWKYQPQKDALVSSEQAHY